MTGDHFPGFLITPKWRNKKFYFSLFGACNLVDVGVYLYQIKGQDPGKDGKGNEVRNS